MANDFKELKVYQKAFDLAMQIFEITKLFPKEETYSLTGQIRRSSRAICSNIAEAYRKRQYPSHFICKISDADMENSETQVWLEFATSCGYLEREKMNSLYMQSEEIGRLLHHMMNNSEKYGGHQE
jgi:four helix bundle protein